MNGLFGNFQMPTQYSVPRQNTSRYYNVPFPSQQMQQVQQPVQTNGAENIARLLAGVFQPLVQSASQGNSAPIDAAKQDPNSFWYKMQQFQNNSNSNGRV